jgi:hypothetical protein
LISTSLWDFVYLVSWWKCLTFRGLCIVMYSYNESQPDALFL